MKVWIAPNFVLWMSSLSKLVVKTGVYTRVWKHKIILTPPIDHRTYLFSFEHVPDGRAPPLVPNSLAYSCNNKRREHSLQPLGGWTYMVKTPAFHEVPLTLGIQPRITVFNRYINGGIPEFQTPRNNETLTRACRAISSDSQPKQMY